MAVKRTYYKDRYNDNKVWEVTKLNGGYYLRQYICGEQFGNGLRTISRSKKSPHRFYISWYELEELEHKSEVIANDIHSFAILCRNACARTIEIAFTWLGNDGNSVSGYQDAITLPYGKMMECLHGSKPYVWKALSIDNSMKQAKVVFKSRKNLHAALGNGVIRHKLIRFLRNQFQ